MNKPNILRLLRRLIVAAIVESSPPCPDCGLTHTRYIDADILVAAIDVELLKNPEEENKNETNTHT